MDIVKGAGNSPVVIKYYGSSCDLKGIGKGTEIKKITRK